MDSVRDSERDLQRLLRIPDTLWLGRIEIDLTKGELGTGSDAIVYRTVYDGRQVAVKVLHRALISPRNVGRANFIRKFGEESKRLRQLSHPAIVSFIGVGQAPNGSPCLVLELMEDSLASRIAATPPDTFLQTLSYLIDVAAGLRYLHWKEIIHRDLKPQNVLIVAGSAKISDVGLSRCLHGDGQLEEQMLTRCPGTAFFMAPESLDEGTAYGVALDIFAMGVTILTMFTNKAPAPKKREIHVFADGQRHVTSELERRVDDLGKLDKDHPARPLIERCLQDDPATRPSAAELHQILLDIQQKYTGTDKFAMQSDVARQTNELRTVRGEIGLVQGEIGQVQGEIGQIQRENNELRAQVQALTMTVQALTMTVQRLTGPSDRSPLHAGSAASANFLVPGLSREPQLPAKFIKDVIAKRKWVLVAGPSAIRDKDHNNPTVGCVHRDVLYVGFNFEFGEGVRLFKCSKSLSWTELPLPVDDINRCMALVSGNNNLYMVFTKLPDHQTYAARLAAMGWTMSGASPWEQIWPGVLFHAGSLHLVGGKLQDKTLIKRSTSLTADLQHWSSTEEPVVNTNPTAATFPATPSPVSSPRLLVCQDSMYLIGGHNDGNQIQVPVHRLSHSETQLTWEKNTLPDTPTLAGLASYHNWLWLAGGWSPREALSKVYCVQPSSNEVIKLPPLPSPRQISTMVVFNGKLMLIGGSDLKRYCSEIFSLDLTP